MRIALISASALMLAACGSETAKTPASTETAAAPAPTAAEATAGPAEEEVTYGSAGTYTIDPTHTSLVFKVSHFGMSDYTARFTDVDATLVFNPEDVSQMALEVTVDPASVETNYTGDFKATHPDSEFDSFNEELAQSPAWFNAGAHPEITFTATEITKVSNSEGKVTGDLTFLGVTKPLTLDVTYNGTNSMMGEKIGFTASGSLDRTEFGFDTYAPNIGATVDLQIETEFAKVTE